MRMKTMVASGDTLSTQIVGDELLILDQDAGKIHQLNETAALIWRKCEAGLSAQEVAQALVESYDIGEEAAANDVAATLEKLQALDLICIAK